MRREPRLRRLGLDELAAWWGPLDTQATPSLREASLYDRLFQNPAVQNPAPLSFALGNLAGRIDGSLAQVLPGLSLTTTQLANLAGADKAVSRVGHVLGSLGLTAQELALLTSGEDAQSLVGLLPAADRSLSHENLSRLFRLRSLARGARLKLPELLVLQALADLAPLLGDDAAAPADPEQTRLFLEEQERVRRSGLDLPTIDYLVRHHVQPGTGVVGEARAVDERLAAVTAAVKPVVEETAYPEHNPGARLREVLAELLSTSTDGAEPVAAGAARQVEAVMAIVEGTSEDDAATQAATLESVLAPFVADIESLKTTLVFSPTVDLATQCVLWLEPDLTAEGQSDRFGAWTNHATTGSATVRLPKPTDLSGCLLWLRADLGVTVDGEGLVTGWADQSGQGNHAAQTTPANSPRLLTGGGVAGTAGIDFDGSDDFLSLASLGHTDGDYTVIVVFEQRSTDAEQVLLAGTTGDHVFYAATNTTAKVGVDDGTTTREIDDATVGPQMLTFVLSSGGTSIELHRNGSSAGTATYDGTGGLTAGNVVLGGSSAPLDGVVSEVIVYDHALSATELRIAHGMLGARYGLGASSGSRVLQDGQGPFGLPALQLNGQDDHLLIENIGSGATNYTVVAVHRHDALVDGQGVAILDDGDQSLIFAAQRTGTLTGNPPVVGAHVGGTWFSSGNARAGDQIATWVVDDGDDLASFYRDGEPIGSVAMASATTLTTPAGLGGHAGTTAKTFNGSIACLGIIGGALDATQLSQLHHYLYKLTGHDKRYTLVLQALLDHLRTRDAKTAIADTLGASLQIPAIRAQALLGSWLSSFSTPSSPLVTDFLPATSTTSAATDDQQRHAVIRFSKAATLVRELALTGDDLEGAFGGRKNPAFLDLDALPVEASSYRRFDAMQTAMVDGALMLPSWLTVRCPTANRSAQTGTSTVNVRLKADAARAHSLDGEAWGLLLEPARSNLVSNQDLTTWSPLGSITVSAEIAPDGAVQSMRLQNVNGGATDQLRLVPLPQTPSLAMHTASMWHRVIGTQPTNGSRMQFGGMTPTLSVNSGVVAPEQYWAHRNASAVFTGGSSPTANLIPRDGTNDVGAADYWGMQLEAGAYPTSFIGADNATFTRAADTLVANLADAGIASDGYFDVSLTYAPLYSDAEAAANHDLVYIDDANRIYFDIATKTFIAKIGGVTTASAAVTFSRHQALTITVSHQASGVSLTVAGATTGNGTTTGAAQPALHPVPAQAYILGNATGAQEGASLRRLDWGTSDLPAARKRYRALMAVLDVLALRDTFRARDGSLFNLLAAAASQPSLEQAAGALAAQARWSADDVQICAEALGLRTASLLAQADHLVRLVEAVRAVQRTGSNRAPGWIHVDEEPAAGFAVADEVLTTARAKHSDDGWVEVGRRLRDELRDAQRDALLAYLLQNPPASYGTGPVPNADALYEHLLVDVEMSPCALTSRIKLAISSAQLLIQRALMGVEPTLRLDTIAAREYEWMRNYRVWEANRKVFFYPENWLEPSWRDDKTPQFEALESFLRQGALTDERVEDAYLRYLDDLSELARLEIVGMVHHLVPASTQERVIDEHHVIGRTRGVPRRYFHRIRKNQSYWTPWRELDIEIEDDHILPVIHEGRLFLVGAKFEEVIYEQLEKSVIMQHKITMWSSAWKNGQWSPPILADGEVLSPPLNQEPEPHPTEFHTLVATADSICVVLDKTPSTDGQAWVITGSTDLEIVVRATFDDCRGRLRLESDTGTLQLPVPGSCNLQFTGFRYHRTGSFFAGLKIWFPTSEGVKNVYVIKGEPGFWIQDEHRSGGDVLLPFTSFVYQNGTRSLFAASVTARRLPGYDPVGAIDPDASKSSWPKGQFPQAKTSEEQPISEGWQSQTVVQMPYVNHEDMLRFHAFDHPYFCEVARRVRVMGVAAARQWDSPTALQSLEDVYFESEFTPNDAIVRRPYPRDEFDFSHSGAYSAYNWELFFHVPYLLAKRLLADGRHDEARKWLHAIFDPTEASESGDARRFWKLKPFKEIDDLASVQASLGDDPSGTTAMTKTIKPVFVYVDDAEAEKADLFDIVEQIQAWHEAPFRPFVVARMRPLAFMKATVRLYIENLIAWGDQLFGRDTIESINEATQLYLLAKALLGDKPVHVESPSVASVSVENVGTISSTHPMVQAETLLFQTTSSSDWGGIQASMPEFPAAFCVPQNDALLGLWGTVDDRLFKIRHCLNIEGVARPLPLYEPPIDPALLVDAIAAGLDIGSVLDDLATPRPHYRFEAIVGRALEQVQTVSALGGGLLSAIEKADGERLAVLRQQHEIAIQTMIRETRRDQLNEAKETLAGVEQSRRLAEARFAFYASREKVSLGEQAALDQGSKAADKEASAADYSAAAVAASQAPDLAAGPGAGTGPANWAVFGGSLASAGLDFKANRDRRSAGRSRDQASQAGTLAGYERRWDDWKHQQDLAERELKQIDKQILAAKIRVDIATKELATVDKQREQAKEVEAFLKGKFSNQALYDWHIEQLSELHFQAYKLAYGLCRSAEKAYRYERGEPDARFVQFGHWDGRRKGLLAGDKLLVDLRRMQKAFVDKNRREHELSRSVSLAEHFPEALLALRETGSAVVQLDESFFDRDYPGHYMRRLKSVSLTLPAVTGPYSSVNCTLTLLNNRVRHTAVVGDDYLEEELNDSRFTYHYGAITSVCTSSGQNDSGMIELNFRDERYLPFEGAGSISTWRIDMPHDTNWFDVRSLSDVIVQLSFMARPGGDVLGAAAREAAFPTGEPRTARRLVSARGDLSLAMAAFENSLDPSDGTQTLSFDLGDYVPFIPGVGAAEVTSLSLAALWNVDGAVSLPASVTAPSGGTPEAIELTATPFTLAATGESPDGWTLTVAQSDILALGADYIEDWPDTPQGTTPFKRIKPAALHDLVMIVGLSRETVR
ncbi:MAG: hypothetical protein KC731_00185 [Myxococcales bacterium]|nr:hypothetical protein [Myxococcales bacterium]